MLIFNKHTLIVNILSFFDLFDIYKQDLNLINKNTYKSIYCIVDKFPILLVRKDRRLDYIKIQLHINNPEDYENLRYNGIKFIKLYPEFFNTTKYVKYSQKCKIFYKLKSNRSKDWKYWIAYVKCFYSIKKYNINISYMRDIVQNKNIVSNEIIAAIFYYVVRKQIKDFTFDLLKDQRLIIKEKKKIKMLYDFPIFFDKTKELILNKDWHRFDFDKLTRYLRPYDIIKILFKHPKYSINYRFRKKYKKIFLNMEKCIVELVDYKHKFKLSIPELFANLCSVCNNVQLVETFIIKNNIDINCANPLSFINAIKYNNENIIWYMLKHPDFDMKPTKTLNYLKCDKMIQFMRNKISK